MHLSLLLSSSHLPPSPSRGFSSSLSVLLPPPPTLLLPSSARSFMVPFEMHIYAQVERRREWKAFPSSFPMDSLLLPGSQPLPNSSSLSIILPLFLSRLSRLFTCIVWVRESKHRNALLTLHLLLCRHSSTFWNHNDTVYHHKMEFDALTNTRLLTSLPLHLSPLELLFSNYQSYFSKSHCNSVVDN